MRREGWYASSGSSLSELSCFAFLLSLRCAGAALLFLFFGAAFTWHTRNGNASSAGVSSSSSFSEVMS